MNLYWFHWAGYHHQFRRFIPFQSKKVSYHVAQSYLLPRLDSYGANIIPSVRPSVGYFPWIPKCNECAMRNIILSFCRESLILRRVQEAVSHSNKWICRKLTFSARFHGVSLKMLAQKRSCNMYVMIFVHRDVHGKGGGGGGVRRFFFCTYFYLNIGCTFWTEPNISLIYGRNISSNAQLELLTCRFSLLREICVYGIFEDGK